MQKLLLMIAACIPLLVSAVETEPLATDTTIILNGKRIEVKESRDRTKVRVYEIKSDDEIVEDELVFEGHYQDGQSYEKRRRTNAITISLPNWNKKFNSHWAGFGMGFANFADGSLHINDIDGVSLRSEKSLEYNLNFLERNFRLSRQYNWALVTGMGIRWNRYRLDENKHFKEENGVTSLHPAPEGITYKASKLNMTSLTIPLFLEWQPAKKGWRDFFVSFGVVGVVKTASSSKVVYRDENGKKRKDKMDSGMNLRPVSMDLMFQMGYDWIGFYMKYMPLTVFEHKKGPKLHPVSIGFHLHI